MSDTLVTVANVSKKFCRRLKRSLWYGVQDMGAELVGRNNSHKSLRKEEFWAAWDISFDLKRGETLGLIGPNGAGKTTLLRMLNGLIKIDTGRIEIKGRMQALIALGAGFNPILTGRENIYVNASVLGIPKAEIERRFDEIVDFSGIEEFIDTPVQSYSSGMAVRLGFAVAANMDPDILLVDEVLAVGDLNFQAKCRQCIQELLKKGVVTILVSHNMHAISHLCTRTIVLTNGKILYDGNSLKAIDVYRGITERLETTSQGGTGEIEITKFEVMNKDRKIQEEFSIGETVILRLHYHCNETVYNPIFNVPIYGTDGNQITGMRTDVDGVNFERLDSDGYVEIIIEKLYLLPNVYTMDAVIFHADGFAFYYRISEVAHLKVIGGQQINGIVYIPHHWNFL